MTRDEVLTVMGWRRSDGTDPRRTLVVTPASTPRRTRIAMYAVFAIVVIAIVVALSFAFG